MIDKILFSDTNITRFSTISMFLPVFTNGLKHYILVSTHQAVACTSAGIKIDILDYCLMWSTKPG